MAQLIPIPFIVVTVSLLIRAEFRSEQRQIFLFKPLSTLLMILVAALSFLTPNANVGYTVGILIGLLLSLGGDVALMFPSGKAFLLGLVIFLLGHVAYAVTFTLANGFFSGDLVSGGTLLVPAIVIYRYLEPGLDRMKGPVIAYIAII